MGKYLKLFDNYTQYEQFMTENMILPNVSYCQDEYEVYMSKENRLIAIYNVTKVSNTSLYSSDFVNSIQRIWIDDTEHQNISNTYNFENTGRHVIKILLKDNITSISSRSFRNCPNLTSIMIPEGVTSIGNDAFSYCSGLTNVTIPEGVTSISYWAFQGCTSLTNMVIPEGVTSIGNSAFKYCSSLTSINIPESVTSIDNEAFSGCSSLTSIKVDEKNAYYDSRNDCNAIIETNSNILVSGCASTVIPSSVISIGNYAFSSCSMSSIVIPEGVTSIGNYAFEGCSSLTNIVISESVTSIGSLAFNGCSSLTSIEIPSGITSIGVGAFNSCSSLANIIVDENNLYYDSRNDCNAIIETQSNTLLYGCVSTVIPESVTSIGGFAFSDCSSLTSITIPEGVTSIGNQAFYGCINLINIVISKDVRLINYAAFMGCLNLTSIIIPRGITSIDTYAFYGCNSLTSFTCLATNPPTLGSNAFNNMPGPIYVPAASVNSYKAANGWSNYASKIQAIQE